MATDSVVKMKSKSGDSKPPSRAGKSFSNKKPLTDVSNEEKQIRLFGSLTSQIKILIIEDSAFLRAKMSRILSEQGYSVIDASNREEGIKKFRESSDSISLVILNTAVDEYKGLETIDELRGINQDVLMLLKTTKKERRDGDLGEHMARGVRAMLKGKITDAELLKKVNRIFELNRRLIENALRNNDSDTAREILDMRTMAYNPPPPVSEDVSVPAREEQMSLLNGSAQPIHGKTKSIKKKKARISNAYDSIAEGYESHMKITNHFQTMAAVDGNFYKFFGSTIADLACGDGQLMRRWAREYLVEMVKIHPEYVVRYLGVDISERMIGIAKGKLDELKKEFKENYGSDIIGNNLVAQFIVSDIGNLGKTIKLEDTVIEAPEVETVLISYGMHWFPDKGEVAGVVSRILEKDGGIFRSIEEKSEPLVDGKGALTLHITDSIHLPKELAESVENEATPIPLDDMREMFAKHDLIWLPHYQVEHYIGGKSDNHIIYGDIFLNAGNGHNLEDVKKNLSEKIDRRQKTINTIPPGKKSMFTKPPIHDEDKNK